MSTRLSPTDAMWLNIEDSTTSAHTVSLIVIEPSELLSHKRLQQLVGSSLPRLARFRSRLVGKPLGVGQPLWAEVDDYDPTSQIHSATIRAPGGRREFAELIGQLSTEPHNRRDRCEKPWEAWSIDGLAGGRWALAVKMSPALNDGGVGAASVWSRLLGSGPHDRSIEPTEPSLGPPPSVGELLVDTMTDILESQLESLWLIAEAGTGVLQAVHDQLHGTSEPDTMPRAVSSMSGPLRHNVFDAPLTERRAVAFASIPRAQLETVSTAFGGTISNVFLAACTLSLRAWLQRHGTVPDDPLQMEMPLALTDADPTAIGNPLMVGRIRIPVQLDDPVQVLTNLHTTTERLKTARMRDDENTGPKVDYACIGSLIPSAVVHAGMRLYDKLGLRQRISPICHGSVSYVSGPPLPAYCAGAKVVGMPTVAPLLNGRGLNITLTSHRDVLDVSVCVCPDNVPAVDDIATGIAQSVATLVAAAQKSPRGQGRSVVTEMASHAVKHWRARDY
ncbi:MAG TPA: wax ester/triacylglycerol synthase domain-containing protein [Mycobacterium sp.]|uniref:wax ester/triacylglycerol synthase domain-containing protein n=1 Tax=Mycobacterium sp. TaxID=1785 RepID=UPI002D23428E|nr:wax ester/triacylglycerol synthase domain-containing protein [Mycobacterium sp.]HZU46345.1 wax ester/triacylglycerol synthase domain-containing protein [Mycobacterium sp.]